MMIQSFDGGTMTANPQPTLNLSAAALTCEWEGVHIAIDQASDSAIHIPASSLTVPFEGEVEFLHLAVLELDFIRHELSPIEERDGRGKVRANAKDLEPAQILLFTRGQRIEEFGRFGPILTTAGFEQGPRRLLRSHGHVFRIIRQYLHLSCPFYVGR